MRSGNAFAAWLAMIAIVVGLFAGSLLYVYRQYQADVANPVVVATETPRAAAPRIATPATATPVEDGGVLREAAPPSEPATGERADVPAEVGTDDAIDIAASEPGFDPTESSEPPRTEPPTEAPAAHEDDEAHARGEAHFVLDQDSGCRIWVPGSIPQNSLRYRGECRGGLAHGVGEAALVMKLGPDDERFPLSLKGNFRDGVFLGDARFDDEIVRFRWNAFLVGLPAVGGSETWLDVGFDHSPRLERCGRYRPRILIVAQPDWSPLAGAQIQESMEKAARAYKSICPDASEVTVAVVPRDHRREKGVSTNSTRIEPILASADIAVRTEPYRISSYRNPAAEADEERRAKEARDAALARGRALGPTRAHFDVRGVRLWMQLDEVRATLGEQVEHWQPDPTPTVAESPYARRRVKAILRDGAMLECEFASTQSGGRLHVLVYEQHLRNGPTSEALLADLRKKYGDPDEGRDSGAYWATYYLQSAVAPVTAYGPLGAFFKVHFRRGEDERVEFVSLVFNDASLGDHDRHAIYEARRAAELREFERRKSDRATF